MKVNFLIIGAMKSGTTSLSELLSNHPDVGFSDPKEPNFFSKTDNWKTEIESYHKTFPKDKIYQLYGEASTSYAAALAPNSSLPSKIASYNPEIKIIYMVRHPLQRMVSQYVHDLQRGREQLSLEGAIKKKPRSIALSKYYMQVKPYIDTFGRENVLIINFQDFTQSPETELKRVASFLNIDFNKFQKRSHHANRSIGEQKLPPSMDKYFQAVKPIVQKIPKKYRVLAKNKLAELRGTAVNEKPQLSEELKRWIWNELDDDLTQFETISGISIDTWKNQKLNYEKTFGFP